MRFTKMTSLGNDFVFVDGIHQNIHDPNRLAKFVSNRNYGVGADGLVLICPSQNADFRMRIFNPDGTEAQICGNAIRSVGKFVYHYGITRKTRMRIETIAGVKVVTLDVKSGKVVNITANFGSPILDAAKAPVITDLEQFIDQPVEVLDRTFHVTAMSLGNPHMVAFVEDVDHFDLEKYGPAMEHHPLYPERANCEFAEILAPDRIRFRVWERSVGETLACGTGSCASVVAGVLTGRCNRSVDVEQKGGVIHIEWDECTGDLFMTGPSTVVFDGEFVEGNPYEENAPWD